MFGAGRTALVVAVVLCCAAPAYAAETAVEVAEFLVGTEVIPAPHKDLQHWLGRQLRDDLSPFDPPSGG